MQTMMGWHPIDTAPRDGTPILLLRLHPITRSRDFIVSGYWFAYEDQWVSEMSAIPVRFPLYWMPLPPTPTEGTRDDND